MTVNCDRCRKYKKRNKLKYFKDGKVDCLNERIYKWICLDCIKRMDVFND